jgi:hypothetical protein
VFGWQQAVWIHLTFEASKDGGAGRIGLVSARHRM